MNSSSSGWVMWGVVQLQPQGAPATHQMGETQIPIHGHGHR